MVTTENNEREPVEILAEEFLQKKREGESVSIEDYVNRYPIFAAEIKEIFPALVAMEVAKPSNVIGPPLESFDAVARGKITRLGDFRIVRKIAHGGMGVIYEAEEVSLDRKVAIKVLASHLITDQSALKRFQREAKTIARLHHTNIVSVYGAGVENELYFFVMEFIDGKSLDRLIGSGEFEKKYAGNWVWIAEVTKRIALALRHAHQKNILHRDVKPGNILIDADQKPWITDFGLAKFDEYDDLTRPGDAVGTLRYMAPEQMYGQTDERTDVFSLGMVLYEMLTGAKAYGGLEDRNGLAVRIKNQDLPKPSRLNPRVPFDLEKIALKAIEVDPKDRYQQAIDFADDLDRWQHDLPIHARQITTFELIKRWSKRNPVIAGLSAVVSCLVLVLMISFIFLAFAWLGENGARLDAKLAQLSAEEARKDAEKSATLAITVLDQLTHDLGVYNLVGDSVSTNQNILFSPMGGIPVSQKNEKQLDLILDFYRSIGQWSDNRQDIRYRRFLAKTRSGEIAIQLSKYEQANRELSKVVEELRNESNPKLVKLRLYANYLMGFTNLLQRNYEKAKSIFESQLNWVSSQTSEPSEWKMEKGKLFLGLGIHAHYTGDIELWHDYVVKAIGEFEDLVDIQNPVDNAVAAVFLARSYLNLPPEKINLPEYRQFYFQSLKKAVSILQQLHQGQMEKAVNQGSIPSLVFFYDYCEAVSFLPPEIEQVQLSNGETAETVALLNDAITTCRNIVESNGNIPAFRFALAKCKINLARRVPVKFEAEAAKAIGHFEWLIEKHPRDHNFLTECGEARLRIGLFHLTRRNLPKAKTAFQLAIADLDKSMECSSSYPKTQRVLPDAHEKLALVFDQLEETKMAAYHRSKQSMLEKAYPHPR